MQTVLGSLASTLGVLALVGVAISVLIALTGLRQLGSKGRNTAAAKSVDDAKALLNGHATNVQGTAAPEGLDQPKPEGGVADTLVVTHPKAPDFDPDILGRFAPKPWASPPWIVPLLAGLAATLISILIGTQFLYGPMVNETYRQLYKAYCRTDGIVEVLSRQVADRNIGTVPKVDACTPPATATASAAMSVALTQDDVFFLLNALGLRDTREKTRTELFAGGDNPTKNHELATYLTDPKVYTVGTPTSLLLLRIAGKVAQGSATEVSCPTSNTAVEATQIGFKTAVLSAVLAQQPYGEKSALGVALLGPDGPTPLDKVLPFEKSACDGNKALASINLGEKFGGDGLTDPLLDKPEHRLTEAQVVSLALGWAGWKPVADTKLRSSQDAAIAFMEAITSEVAGTPEVRDAKIAVNFFIGWERLAILCIVPFLALCLLWQQSINSDDSRHLRDIRQTVRETKRDRQLRVLSLAILAKRLYRSVGRSAPREILVAALEVNNQASVGTSTVDFDRVHRVADHEMRIMDRNRFFFLAGLPLLPTIGFVGTVRSLIEALSLADRIPRARTAIEQVAAVSDVTSTLSLCFSTTFMALGALLIFAPLDLWQATSERRVVEETERLLDPGSSSWQAAGDRWDRC